MNGAKVLRVTMLWAALLATAGLAVLAAAGAFLGADRAKVLFTSRPLAAFWIGFAILLAAGIVFSKGPLRRPGVLAMHLGAVMVLAGAMWASETGHALAAGLTGVAKVPAATMILQPGGSTDVLLGPELEQIGKLPFSLHLRDFWIEYYRSDRKWRLIAEVSPHRGSGQAVSGGAFHREIDWQVGRELRIAGTDTFVTVGRYLPGARLQRPDDAKGTLEVRLPGGRKITLPAAAGSETTLAEPPVTVRVAKVFSRLVVLGRGKDLYVADAPEAGKASNPAVLVEITYPDGTAERQYVFRRAGMQRASRSGLEFTYAAPAVSVVADAASGLPAMRLAVRTDDGRAGQAWLMAKQRRDLACLPLTEVLGPPAGGAPEITLWLARPPAPIKSYKSDLAVVENGKVTAEKVLEVNHPLHYGGYHFYQSSYDAQGRQYTVLDVTSDSGTLWIHAGMLLLVAGAAWRFYGRPVVTFLRKRAEDGN